MKLPPLPKLPKPREPDQAFRAGVRGAPCVIIDDLPVIPLVVSRTPGPCIGAVERLRKWPPAQNVSDFTEQYKIGRGLRGIALKLEGWGEGASAFMETGQILLDHGAMHLRMNQPYGLEVLLEDYGKLLASLPDEARHDESVDDILSEIRAFANKRREWDEHDF
ncbi:MAG: hypothetical protein KGN02_01445 [bacterium]|nr:hypothetical protein [bacterium]